MVNRRIPMLKTALVIVFMMPVAALAQPQAPQPQQQTQPAQPQSVQRAQQPPKAGSNTAQQPQANQAQQAQPNQSNQANQSQNCTINYSRNMSSAVTGLAGVQVSGNTSQPVPFTVSGNCQGVHINVQ
jgi:outer membrane biosynthesis protein TonB